MRSAADDFAFKVIDFSFWERSVGRLGGGFGVFGGRVNFLGAGIGLGGGVGSRVGGGVGSRGGGAEVMGGFLFWDTR